MRIGDAVEVLQPVLRGTIVQRRFNPKDEVELLVRWEEGGQPVERWLTETQLKLVEVQP
jgi:hypothetical protein